MSDEKRILLLDAIRVINETKNNKKNEIEKLKEDIKKLQNNYNELLNEEPKDYSNDEIEDLKEELSVNEKIYKAAQALLKIFNSEFACINDILNANVNFIGFDLFASKVSKLRILGSENEGGILSSDSKQDFDNMSRITGIKFPFTSKQVNDTNESFKRVELGALMLSPVAPQMGIILTPDKKREKVDKIREDLKSVYNYYQKMIVFVKKVVEYIENDTKELKNRIESLKLLGINSGKQEVLDEISEINNKINKLLEDIKVIDFVNDLYKEFNETNDQSILVRLTNELQDLKVLKPRDARLITYESKTDEKKVVTTTASVKVKEEKIEEKPAVMVNEPKIITNPAYYREPYTQNIICFLGKDGDDIFTDITDHFDASNRPYLVSELVELFNVLYVNKDYENKTGGNPKYFSSSKVRSYREKLGFNYKRFGVGQAQYRIHAITRDSKLLKELGYGIGRITFFGALGVNDDNEKTGAYDRIARRGIAVMGNPVKLQPTFEYIEHITKNYIPFELLSNADKERVRYGMFNGNVKGEGIKKSIENFKYFYYYILDNESKDNVKKWLDDYFEKQSEKMFVLINEHNKRKKKNIG